MSSSWRDPGKPETKEIRRPLDTGLASRHFLRRTARWRERSLEAENPGNQYTVRKYRGRLFKWAVWRVK